MAAARQKTRRRVAVLAALLPGVVPAAGDEAAVERCRESESAADRIACLEAALLGETSGKDQSPAADTPAVPGIAPGPGGVAGPQPTGEPEVAAPVPDAASGQAAEPESEAQAPPSASPDGNERATADIGAEQLPRSETREERTATLARASGLAVSEYEHVPYRRLLVTLENGQAWLQIQGDTQYVRASLRKNQTVDIEESSLGGYKMRLNEMRRTIRVQRIR